MLMMWWEFLELEERILDWEAIEYASSEYAAEEGAKRHESHHRPNSESDRFAKAISVHQSDLVIHSRYLYNPVA